MYFKILDIRENLKKIHVHVTNSGFFFECKKNSFYIWKEIRNWWHKNKMSNKFFFSVLSKMTSTKNWENKICLLFFSWKTLHHNQTLHNFKRQQFYSAHDRHIAFISGKIIVSRIGTRKLFYLRWIDNIKLCICVVKAYDKTFQMYLITEEFFKTNNTTPDDGYRSLFLRECRQTIARAMKNFQSFKHTGSAN